MNNKQLMGAQFANAGLSTGLSLIPGVGPILGAASGMVGNALIQNAQQKEQDRLLKKEQSKILQQLDNNYNKEVLSMYPAKGTISPLFTKGGWIKKATDSIKRRGTEGVCTGSKFGSSSCPPGSKRYTLAKTFKKMAKNRAEGGYLSDEGYDIGFNEDIYFPDGGAIPLSSEDVMTVGNPMGHGSIGGDIPVTNGSGDTMGIVENGEVITDGDKVLSNRSGHAEIGKHISLTKGILENLYNNPNTKFLNKFKRNAADRVKSSISMAMNHLEQANEATFQQQEQEKQEKTVALADAMNNGAKLGQQSMMPYGGILNTFKKKPANGVTFVDDEQTQDASSLQGILGNLNASTGGYPLSNSSRYIDNLAEFMIKEPTIPSPVLLKPPVMDTEYDITKQLQDVTNQIGAFNKDIDSNISGATSLANKQAALAQGLSSKSELYNLKENAETDLKNQLSTQMAATEEANLGTVNDYRMNTLFQKIAKQDRLRENFSNLSEDLQQQVVDTKLYNLDANERGMIALEYWGDTPDKLKELYDNGMFDDITDETVLAQIKDVLGI